MFWCLVFILPWGCSSEVWLGVSVDLDGQTEVDKDMQQNVYRMFTKCLQKICNKMFTEWTLSARERRGGCGVLWKAWESWTLKAEPVLTIRMALSCTEERSKSFRKDSTLCNSSSFHRQAPVVILDRGRPSVRRDTSVKLRTWFGMSSKPYGHRFCCIV